MKPYHIYIPNAVNAWIDLEAIQVIHDVLVTDPYMWKWQPPCFSIEFAFRENPKVIMLGGVYKTEYEAGVLYKDGDTWAAKTWDTEVPEVVELRRQHQLLVNAWKELGRD